MSIDGWLILDIALGIVVGDALRVMVRDTREWWNSRRVHVSKAIDEKPVGEKAADKAAVDQKAVEDWNFLWDNAPESAKEQVRKFVEDERLRKQAEKLDLFHFLWYASSEETKGQLRFRWKLEKIPPRVSE
ncbi:MAG: hypothetical protein WA192_05915 [Candidatus Acidiferrales bacterium]